MIRFTVLGEPLPAERPRTVRRGKRRVTITPDRTLEAEARVATAFREAYPDRTAPDTRSQWAVLVWFHRETNTWADLDNLAKTVLDGLNGVLWADDKQVAQLSATRLMGLGRGAGRTIVDARPCAPMPGESATLDLPDTTTPNGATTP